MKTGIELFIIIVLHQLQQREKAIILFNIWQTKKSNQMLFDKPRKYSVLCYQK
jgi:hypothetical protein